jgi:hypothetical protein
MRACCDRETSCTTFAVHSEQKTAARIPPTHLNPSPAGPRARRMGSRFGLGLHCDFPWKAISHGRGPGVLAKRVRPQYEPTNRFLYCRRSQPWSNCFREIFLATGPAPAGGTPSSEATRRSTGDSSAARRGGCFPSRLSDSRTSPAGDDCQVVRDSRPGVRPRETGGLRRRCGAKTADG